MDARLQELLDHHEIRTLLARYCRACDRMDAAEMASVYCEESWDDHGPNKCDGKAFARLIVADLREADALCSHQLGQSLIAVNGNEAGCETYFTATIRYPLSDTPDRLYQMAGRFLDSLTREGGQWKIKRRICVREWSLVREIGDEWLADAGFVGPGRSADDPSYSELGLAHAIFSATH